MGWNEVRRPGKYYDWGWHTVTRDAVRDLSLSSLGSSPDLQMLELSSHTIPSCVNPEKLKAKNESRRQWLPDINNVMKFYFIFTCRWRAICSKPAATWLSWGLWKQKILPEILEVLVFSKTFLAPSFLFICSINWSFSTEQTKKRLMLLPKFKISLPFFAWPWSWLLFQC